VHRLVPFCRSSLPYGLLILNLICPYQPYQPSLRQCADVQMNLGALGYFFGRHQPPHPLESAIARCTTFCQCTVYKGLQGWTVWLADDRAETWGLWGCCGMKKDETNREGERGMWMES
jgi:hypothetical protein